MTISRCCPGCQRDIGCEEPKEYFSQPVLPGQICMMREFHMVNLFTFAKLFVLNDKTMQLGKKEKTVIPFLGLRFGVKKKEKGRRDEDSIIWGSGGIGGSDNKVY